MLEVEVRLPVGPQLLEHRVNLWTVQFREGGVIEQDLRLLNAVLNWATQAGDGRGGFLLDRNPYKGLPVPKEESPRRALLTAEQYEAMRTAAVASTLGSSACSC